MTKGDGKGFSIHPCMSAWTPGPERPTEFRTTPAPIFTTMQSGKSLAGRALASSFMFPSRGMRVVVFATKVEPL